MLKQFKKVLKEVKNGQQKPSYKDGFEHHYLFAIYNKNTALYEVVTSFATISHAIEHCINKGISSEVYKLAVIGRFQPISGHTHLYDRIVYFDITQKGTQQCQHQTLSK